MEAKLLSKSFRYRDSKETSEPGYLARRFAAIRRKQAESAKQSNVKAIRKVGK